MTRTSTKSERRAAHESVAAYHQARLAELIERVGDGIDRFRAGGNEVRPDGATETLTDGPRGLRPGLRRAGGGG